MRGCNSQRCLSFRCIDPGKSQQSSGFRVYGLGFMVQRLGFRVCGYGLGFMVQGLGFRVTVLRGSGVCIWCGGNYPGMLHEELPPPSPREHVST